VLLAKISSDNQAVSARASKPGANARTKSHFEAAIANSWRSSVAGIMLTGDLLNQAEDELDPEVFRALKLPFGQRATQMLRRLADHPIVSSHANHGSLPPCWRTLYELTKVPDDLLQSALADGRIHPELQRKDIRGQILGLPPRTKKKSDLKAEVTRLKSENTALRSQVRELQAQLRGTSSEMPDIPDFLRRTAPAAAGKEA